MTTGEAKHVFVSYVREDAEQVDKLCQALEAAQIPYWRDRTSLAPGEQWQERVREAIRAGSLVFLACFSEQSRAKSKSYMNEELTLAAEEFRLYPPGTTWLIPVRFDDGDIPEWNLGAGRTLRDLNYIDLFGDQYLVNIIALTSAISKIMGATGPDSATVQASLAEADAVNRPATMRRLTKEMIPDLRKRIELDDLISQETQRLLAAMRNEEQFPSQLASGSNEDKLVRCAEIATSYWQLAQPFVASLQVAARWGDEETLNPWASGLRAVAGEAAKPQGGLTALLNLRHVPALIATFTVALAATGQGRWDNLKTLLVDVSVPQRYGEGREPLVQAEAPWRPFDDHSQLLPNVIARLAQFGEDPRTALSVFMQKQKGTYHTPVAEWLHTILRPYFSDQFVDDTAYDEGFDHAEVILGIISQDIDNVRAAANPQRTWAGRSRWFGRSTWRGKYGPGPVDAVSTEIESRGASWPPLKAGLFGGDLDRAKTAANDYAAQFQQMARARW
ncbi:toll/interleukin-1 receptor domain-containing protein [Amycolatopsis sp. NPDC052450]|uniref:toll/interleukin-1 receptor domain-containing protein n=1 Tax=Amycolatopsis sp. NPDC052450 TaxID=3363937 RepID=UPI0037C8F609